MTTPAVLEAAELSFGYRRGVPVLAGVSLRLQAGEITAVLGPNGAGKSSLLHLLLGIHRPWHGEIRVFGRPLSAYPRAVAAQHISLVPQREHVAFTFRVAEYLLLGRSPHLGMLAQPSPADRRTVAAALARVGIAHLQHREVAALSGGEHQLVLIARALVQGAPIMLMDEPASHLDLAHKHHVWRLLRALADDGHTILLTTHDPNAAASLADRVVLLRDGRVLASGSPHQTLTPEHLGALYGLPIRVVRAQGGTFIFPAENRVK